MANASITANASFTTNTSITSNATKLAMCAIKITGGFHLSSANEQVFQNIYVPSFVLTTVMLLIGGPGNSLVFYIYFAKWRKSTARIFILALAGFDMVNCLVTMPMEMAVLYNIIVFDHPIVCKVFRNITFTMNNGSSFVLTGIAYDRYNRICRPLKKQLDTLQAKKIVVASMLFSVVFAWPSLVLYGTQTIPIPVPGKPYVCLIGKTCLYEDSYVPTVYPLLLSLLLTTGNVIIDAILIFVYSKIGYEVWQRSTDIEYSSSKKTRKASTSTLSTDDNMINRKENTVMTPLNSSSGKEDQADENKTTPSPKKAPSRQISTQSMKMSTFRQRSLSVASIESRKAQMHKTTLMLFMVTLLFMGSFVPYCVIAIIRAVNKDYYLNLSTVGKAVYNLFLRTYMLSSSLNPIIYSFLSVEFRKECGKLFNRAKYVFSRK